jgi:hypothetical protein
MTELSKFLQPFATILPSMEETLLLRAGLASEEPARRAWHEWRSTYESTFIGHNPSIQKLRLLLSQAHQRNNFEMDKASQTFLKLSYFKEDLRRDIYRRLCRNVLEIFDRSAIAVIVLKGAALAETVYAPSIRHCHDIDLLLNHADINEAAAKVSRLGFRKATSASAHSLRLEHDSGLPLELHTQLFQNADGNAILAEIRQRVQSCFILGVGAEIFSPEDNLLHVCVHAFYSSSRQSLRWVGDAWHIIVKHRRFDWELLLHTARRSHLTLPLEVMFNYLAEALGSAVPANVLGRLGGYTL